MPGYYKTEGVVLRSMRLREADRIVHLYTGTHGRIGAVVKGVRRTKSRFGGRLEPFFRVRLVLYEGRGDLDTVTQAEAIEWYPRLRESHESPALGGRGVRVGPAAVRRGRGQRGRLQPALPRAPAARRAAGGGRAGEHAGVPPQAAAGGRLRARADGLRALRRGARGRRGGRHRVLAGRGRHHLRRLRARRGLLARRRRARLHGRCAGAAAARRARGASPDARPGGPGRHRDARIPCPRAAAQRRLALRPPARQWRNGSTTSRRARARCASCSAARAPTSPR